jgi:prophage regulatory protein
MTDINQNQQNHLTDCVPQQGATTPTLDGRSAAPCNRILRLPEVIGRVGLKRASIYLHMNRGSFPKPINLGLRAVGWLEGEIEAWIAARIEVTRRGGK